VVTIDGAHGVTLTGFTIQNGPGEGILGQRGATFAVQQTTVQQNAASGIAVADGSTADLTDCTVQDNGSNGLDVFTSSSVILRGSLPSCNHEWGDRGLYPNRQGNGDTLGDEQQGSGCGTATVDAPWPFPIGTPDLTPH
jgi:hypothetical protein